jgi:hypothetical protein
MRGTAKIPLLIGAFLVLVVILIALGEGYRRMKLNEDSQGDTTSASQTTNNSTPVETPPTEITIDLLPSQIQRFPTYYKGPATVQISIFAPNRISLALVPVEELGSYFKSEALTSNFEHLPCGTSGAEQLTAFCELPAGKTFALFIGDRREPLRRGDNGYVAVMRSKKGQPPAEYTNRVTGSVTLTVIPPGA